MIENKKSLSLLRTCIDKLDTQLWATIGERISIWTDVNKEKKILYREELSLFLQKNKHLFQQVNQDFFLKFLARIEVFCKKEKITTSSENTDYALILSKDKLIVKLLEERFETAYKIGLIKKKQKIPIIDSVRYQKILDSTQKKAKTLNIPPKMVDSLLDLIHEYSVELQKSL